MSENDNMSDGTGFPPDESPEETESGRGDAAVPPSDQQQGSESREPLIFDPARMGPESLLGRRQGSEPEEGEPSGEQGSGPMQPRGEARMQRPGRGEEHAGPEGIQSKDPDSLKGGEAYRLAELKAFDDNMSKLQNMGSSAGEIYEAASANKIPAQELQEFLTSLGHDKKKIFQVMQEVVKRQKELPKDFEKSAENNVQEDMLQDTLKSMKKAADPDNGMTDEERQKVLDEGGELVEGVVQNMRKERTGVKKRLFDEETGLLRRDEWKRRLVLKPGVTIAIALIIAYMAMVHAVTKGTQRRAGSG